MEIDDPSQDMVLISSATTIDLKSTDPLQRYLANQTKPVLPIDTAHFSGTGGKRRRGTNTNNLDQEEKIHTKKFAAKTLLYHVHIHPVDQERPEIGDNFDALFPKAWGKFFLNSTDAEQTPIPPLFTKRTFEFRLLRSIHCLVCPPLPVELEGEQEGKGDNENQQRANDADLQGWTVLFTCLSLISFFSVLSFFLCLLIYDPSHLPSICICIGASIRGLTLAHRRSETHSADR